MDIKIRNAIISVSDKTGLEGLARSLHGHGVRIYSTGGTSRAIEKLDIPVNKISDYTGFPEILGGRVKSLHPKIHGGILAKKDDPEHLEQMRANEISSFDLIVINLYPFEQVIKKERVTIEEAIENIDIGGPSMLRSAAKNYRYVCVVPGPEHYETVMKEMEEKGSISLQTREKLALAVFDKTSYYDSIIASYLHSVVDKEEGTFPQTVSLHFGKKLDLRYGENPHQSAAFYTNPDISVKGVSCAKQLHGKELSFNNILDIEAALEIVKDFDEPACSVIKHTNPCGAASASTLGRAFLDAWAGDPISAFGSIIGCNRGVDEETARAILDAGFVECVITPGFTAEGLEVLRQKKNIRLLETGPLQKNELYDVDMKRIVGGLLIQQRDLEVLEEKNLITATRRDATDEERKALLFAWKIVKHVKSNAVVLAEGTKTVGIGAGQMSRVDSTFIAVSKAKERSRGSVLASDAFFPKPDAIELAAKHGVTAIIQPGGSIRDEDAVKACDEAKIAMLFTGMRHFKH